MRSIKNKNIKWWLGVTSCIMLFAIIGIFAYMKTSFLIKGIKIEAEIERNNGRVATVKGKVPNAIHVSLNGREIFIDKDGSFSEPVALLPGLSVVTLDVADKFGKTKEKKFQLVNKESAPSVALVEPRADLKVQ